MGSKSNLYMSDSKAWLNMLRISNSPTVVSNIMVGVAIAIQSHHEQWSHKFTPPPLQLIKPLFLITLILLMLYFAGMILNDAFDAKRDKENRPDRPIPQGVITARQAWVTGFILLMSAVLMAIGIGVSTVLATSVLAITIILYTFLHNHTIAGIFLMALCRGLVYITAVTAFSTPYTFVLLIFFISIMIYTSLLTYVGSFENNHHSPPSWVVWLALFPSLVPVIIFGHDSPIAWLAFLAFSGWMFFAWYNFRNSNSGSISGMHKLLSGFALLDCVLIASLGEYFIMITSAFCFVLTVAAHRKILGT